MKARFLTAVPYAADALNLPVHDVEAALPFYQTILGFHLAERHQEPQERAILERDEIRIGLAKNGGDPTQEGCFFEVDDVETAFLELRENGLQNETPNYRIDKYGDVSFKVFFVVAPDGLCYCLGQRQTSGIEKDG